MRYRCLFAHRGRMGKALDQITEPERQETFRVQESGGPFKYPEQTTPIVLVTPIPSVNWTKFPQLLALKSKHTHRDVCWGSQASPHTETASS